MLTGDLKGKREAVATIVEASPDVFAHNLETSERLHRKIRPGFRYERTLEVLRMAKELNPVMPTKSNIIVGMGETDEEVYQCLRDLREANVDLVTIGQYLAPSVGPPSAGRPLGHTGDLRRVLGGRRRDGICVGGVGAAGSQLVPRRQAVRGGFRAA